MTIDTHELAWAAGFFDGEGCVQYVRTKRKHLSRAQRAIRIDIFQSYGNQILLERFQTAVGFGSILGPYIGKTSHGYTYRVTAIDEIEKIFSMLQPYLGKMKADDFQRAISRYHSHDWRKSV